jgi:hypothetical protein
LKRLAGEIARVPRNLTLADGFDIIGIIIIIMIIFFALLRPPISDGFAPRKKKMSTFSRQFPHFSIV